MILKKLKRISNLIQKSKTYEGRIRVLENSVANLALINHTARLEFSSYKEFLKSKEFSIYSQNGEDGLLLFIFSVVGTTNMTFVEFGFGDGSQCNCSNLVKNFGWNGLFIDGDAKQISSARKNLLGHDKVKIKESFITAENINEIIKSAGVSGSIDLLSIDIDGNDYWVWEKLNVIDPRVVIVEYNANLGPQASLSVPYDPKFNRFQKHKSGLYYGASILALYKLAQLKGYELIGSDSNGVNCLFIKKELISSPLKKVEPSVAYYSDFARAQWVDYERQMSKIRRLDFVEI